MDQKPCIIPVGVTIAKNEKKKEEQKRSSTPYKKNSSHKKKSRGTYSVIMSDGKNNKKGRFANSSWQALIEGVALYSICLLLPSLLGALFSEPTLTNLESGGALKSWLGWLYFWPAKFLLLLQTQGYRDDHQEQEQTNILKPEPVLSSHSSGQYSNSTAIATDAQISDVGIIILVTITLAITRLLIVYLLVPRYLAPKRMEALVRCKSVHLLSSEYNLSSLNLTSLIASPRGSPRKPKILHGGATGSKKENTDASSNLNPLKSLPQLPFLASTTDHIQKINDNYDSTGIRHDSHNSDDSSTSSSFGIGLSIDSEDVNSGFPSTLSQARNNDIAKKQLNKNDNIHSPYEHQSKPKEGNLKKQYIDDAYDNEIEIESEEKMTGNNHTRKEQQSYFLNPESKNDEDDGEKGEEEQFVDIEDYDKEYDSEKFLLPDDEFLDEELLVATASNAIRKSLSFHVGTKIHESSSFASFRSITTNVNSGSSFAAPKYATAVFRLLYCTISCTMALILFRDAYFWPWYVFGNGSTVHCWDLSGGVALAKVFDVDFDSRNTVLRYYFLVQVSYHLHSAAFHVLSVVLMLMISPSSASMINEKEKYKNNRKWSLFITAYLRSLFHHTLSLIWIGGAYFFSSLRRLGAIGMFAYDSSSWFLHLLQLCMNSPNNSNNNNNSSGEDENFLFTKPTIVKYLHRYIVVPSFVYFRLIVWSFVGLSALSKESQYWLIQLESTLLIPGSGKYMRICFQLWMLLWMGFNMIHFKRLIFHPHLISLLKQEKKYKKEKTQSYGHM